MAYTPKPAGQFKNMEELVTYLKEELQALSAELLMIEEGRAFPVLTVAPTKPRDGMIVIADGTSWNPGSGKGAYEYRTGSWYKL